MRNTPTSSTTDRGRLTFAVPDLHGRLDLLDAALDSIEAYAEPREDEGKVVFLGDYIDRGPQGAQVLSRLMEGPQQGWQWICLKGNHEAMMALALRNPERLEWWIDNGGDATIASYSEDRDVVAAHLTWIDALPTMHVDANRVFVHAGVDRGIPLDKQAERTLIWKRYPPDVDEGHGHRHVVHGHDPNIDGPLQLGARTDLDTLAWRTGRLVVGVFENRRAGGPIDLIEVMAEVRRPLAFSRS